MISLMFILVSGMVYSQNECQVNITYVMNKSLPPSYTFKTDFQSEDAKFYWHFSNGARYEERSPTHTFKTTGNYVVEVKVTDNKGSVCFGRTVGLFEGIENSTKDTTQINAKGWVKDISSIAGCGLVISTDDGKVLLPVEILPNFALKEGQRIALAFEYLENIATNCMSGRTVKIHRIEEIFDTKPVLIEARGKVVDMSSTDGCSLVIQLSDSITLVPVEILPEIALKQGIYIEFAYEVLNDVSTTCMAGSNIRIHRLKIINVDTTVILSGKGVVKDLSSIAGCGLAIVLENGRTIIPIEFADDFDLKEGQLVELAFAVLKDRASICMAGTLVKVIKIAEIPITQPVFYTGTGKVKDMSSKGGCKFVIVLESGRTLIPHEILHDFRLMDGQYVGLEFEILAEAMSVCDMGPVARIHKIWEIDTLDRCKVEPTYKLLSQSKITYQFFARTSVKVTSWEWDFGDGNNSNEAEPEHTFEKAGVYTVVCTIISSDGCKASHRIAVVVQEPGLPVCPGGINLLLFDPSENKCDGKAIATLLDGSQNEYKDVVYRWSTGETGNTATNLCADKPYYLHVLIEGVCQKNTSFTFLSKPMWRVSSTGEKYTFQVTNPVDGVTYIWDLGNGEIAYGTSVSYDFKNDGDYNIRLIASYGAVSNESEKVIRVQNTVTNIDVTEKPSFKIYPNPAGEKIWIESGQSITGTIKAEIYDLRGRVVYQGVLDFTGQMRSEINIHHLPSGFYFIRISDGNTFRTEKLVVM